jgi:RNA polymerase sigma-70 factor, ECF subfamily
VTVPTAPQPRRADLDLATRCVQGDRAAQEQLFDAQRQRVHRILYRVLGSNRDLEDLAQEAFVAVFRSLAGFRGEASLSTWVDRITTRVALRHLSRTPVAARLELVRVDAAFEAPSPEEQLHQREIARRLYGVLDRLAPKYRIAYALHEVDGRPIAEVAVLTEVSVVAAKNRVWRARRQVHRAARLDPVLGEFLGEIRRGAR